LLLPAEPEARIFTEFYSLMNRILLVEDDKDLCALMHEILQNDGYEIETAHNGAQALALDFVEPADLVITDVFMPKINGLETIVELRKQNPDLHFIAISGGGEKTLSLARKIGAHATLEKPFSGDKLVRAVSRLIGDSRRFPRPSLG
jgi:DNA-binding NtrC family response regulator